MILNEAIAGGESLNCFHDNAIINKFYPSKLYLKYTKYTHNIATCMQN